MALDKAKTLLLSEGHTCVLFGAKGYYTSKRRGVAPLVRFLQQGQIPPCCLAADKVVGKATAYLYILLKIQALYAQVISKPALAVLTAYGICVEYETLVENIINRAGDGICPFEEAVMDISHPQTAYDAILRKIAAMNISLEETI